MHDVIQEMGWEIVREESPQKPGKRSRLHNAEDVCRVLKGNKGTAKVQSISCGFSFDQLKLDPQAFTRMDSLRFLVLQYMKYDGTANLEYLPDALRYLYWSFYPLQSLPSKFSPDNLIELHMPRSNLKRLWGNSQNPRKLKRIDLHGSMRLVDFPDLSESVNIEWISLVGCESLVQVPSYVQKCTKLTHLNLNHCSKLSILPDLPANLEFLNLSRTAIEELPPSVWSLEKLRHLDLSLSSFINFPEIAEHMEQLYYLDLTRTKIEELPSNFGNLVALKELRLGLCERLKVLPSSFGNLVGLKKLDLDCCTSLESLSNSFCNLKVIEELSLDGCVKLKELPPSFTSSFLKNLNLRGCKLLEEIPDCSTSFPALEELDLSGCVNLNINSRIHIMDDALRMVTGFRRAEVRVPGDEIPKWFTIRKEGSSLNVELPQHWCNGNFLAIALCSVSAIPICELYHFQCEMILKTNNGETTHSLTFDGPYIYFLYESVETDHVVVCGEVHEIPDKAKWSVEASFHFYTQNRYGEPKRFDNVKRCGVCFLNAQPQAQDESRLLCTKKTLHQQLADDVAAPGPRTEADDG